MRRAIGAALIVAAWLGLYAASDMRHAAGQELPRQRAHVSSIVVFVHYDLYPGEPRAAVLLEDPHACPEGTPNGMTDCANLRFFTLSPSEIENPPVTGSDWRCCVPHDPTGQFHRSWHVWGEAPGEE